jgi:hypothetical protein
MVMIMAERKTNLDKGEHQKLIPLWKGPYRIISEVKENTVFLIDIKGKEKKMYVNRLKEYHERSEWMRIPEKKELFKESEEKLN